MRKARKNRDSKQLTNRARTYTGNGWIAFGSPIGQQAHAAHETSNPTITREQPRLNNLPGMCVADTVGAGTYIAKSATDRSIDQWSTKGWKNFMFDIQNKANRLSMFFFCDPFHKDHKLIVLWRFHYANLHNFSPNGSVIYQRQWEADSRRKCAQCHISECPPGFADFNHRETF